MRTHEPTEPQLLAALAKIKRDNPEIGGKKMLQELKKQFPEWQVSAKRVREVHAQADPDTAPDSEEEDEEAADSLPAGGRDDGLRGIFERQIASFDTLARSGQRVPISQYHTKTNPTLSLAMLRALGDSQFTCGLEVYRSYLDGGEPEEDVSEDLYMLYAPYRLFRAEWRAYLGPNDPGLPRAVPHQDDAEPLQFFTLFPFGIGHYQNQPHRSFEEYAFHRLRVADPMFRENKEWLLWVLCRTQNEELTIAVNCVLAVKHGIKGRHLGQGTVEFESVEDEFVKELVADA